MKKRLMNQENPLPEALKKVLYPLIGLLPFSHQLYFYRHHGRKFFRFRKFFEDSQWYTKEEISQYQLSHLRKMINHAYTRVPYYRKLFDAHQIAPEDIRRIEDLKKIPTLSKETVRKNLFHLTSDDWMDYKPAIDRTSGTTGAPLKVYLDLKTRCLAGALVWRGNNWGGYQFNGRCVLMSGPFGFQSGKIDFDTLSQYDSICNTMKINIAKLSPERLQDITGLLMDFKPAFIISYPSVMHLLASFIAQDSRITVNSRAVFLVSEKLYPHQRKLVEETFGCNTYNFYAMRELLASARECNEGGLHLNPELGILEAIKDGESCAHDETGEFVCTGLHNYSMPFIRYATGDYGRISDEKCPCGRELPVITIEGCREKDLIYTPGGFVNIMSGTPFFRQDNLKIKQIQLYQENKSDLLVRIVRGEGYTDKDTDNMRRALNEYLNHELRIDFEFPEEIPRTEGGKYRFAISRVRPEF